MAVEAFLILRTVSCFAKLVQNTLQLALANV
jgi:hypothetical protein